MDAIVHTVKRLVAIHAPPLFLSFLKIFQFKSPVSQQSPTGQSDLQATTLADLELMSCKAAIKAGQRLHPDEIQALIQDFLASPNNFTCPHDRPLFVHYDKVDLEKLFKRR